MNTHSFRTIGMLVILFVVAGLQAVHELPIVTAYAGIIDMVVPVLLVLEHKLAGNA